LLVDVSIDIDGVQATRMYPRSLPDLFVDDQLLVSGRLKSASGTAKFTIKGRLAGKPVTFTRTVDLGKAPPRPWVGRLWGASRVGHLQEEIALGAKQPELMTELIELALAYNFVTPYTAFLAIPESELGDQRGTIEAARAAKKKIMAQNPDAANLDKNATGATHLAQDHTRNMPQPSPPLRHMADASASRDDEDDAEPNSERSFAGSVQSQRGRGCAGCSTGGDASSLLLLLGLTVLLLRRRHR
jgi:MYXO-CTERM domain-containing protein